MRCSHLQQWKRFLAILRLAVFYRSENGKGQAEGFADFLLLTKIKEKSYSVFGEKNSISHFSERNRKMTASLLSEQCKIPEQGSMNLS